MKLLTLFPFLALAASAFAADIAPEDAAKHVGETATVRGSIAQTYVSKSGNVYLEFGAAYPNQIFSVAVSKQKTPALLADGTKWLEEMQGKTVAVSGKIELVKGKPAITVNAKEDIQTADSAPAAEKKP